MEEEKELPSKNSKEYNDTVINNLTVVGYNHYKRKEVSAFEIYLKEQGKLSSQPMFKKFKVSVLF